MDTEQEKIMTMFVGKKLIGWKLSKDKSMIELIFDGINKKLVIWALWEPYDQTFLDIDLG